MVTIANNTILHYLKVAKKVDLKGSYRKKKKKTLVIYSDFFCNIYKYQIIMLYTWS